MNVEYMLVVAVLIVLFAFAAVIHIIVTDIKKKMVHNKIDKFTIRSGKKITQNEIDKILKYIERNKKYLSPSAYKIGIYKIDKARARI